mmetsp:Transcript_63206/g.131481  ORF Transcript_63206/g.131481 Transcript_63206/m.131481 type:complete len:421 (+) Transcript_63206:135-1397(+)
MLTRDEVTANSSVFKRFLVLLELAQDVAHSGGDLGARAEDGDSACLEQLGVVLLGDDAANHHLGGRADALLLGDLGELADELGDEGAVASGQRRHAHAVYVRLHRLLGDLRGSLEEGADVDVEAEVSKAASNNLLSAIVSVLSHLGDKDTGAASSLLGKFLDSRARLENLVLLSELRGVRPAHNRRAALVASEDVSEGLRDLAQGAAHARALHSRLEQVAVRLASSRQSGERLGNLVLVTVCAHLGELAHLRCSHCLVVDDARLHVLGRLKLELVHANNNINARVEARLLARGTLLDPHLGHARLHGLGHATQCLNLLDHRERRVVEVLGKGFHHVASRPRVDDLGDSRLVLEDELGVACNARGELGGKGNGLIEGVGVQRLRASHHRCHPLDRSANHVVVRVLGLKGIARGLAMGAEEE